MEREAVLVGIDVGTSKVCALIGEVSRDGRLTIMGHGTVPASGLKKGVVINIDQTVRSIADAVERAERLSGWKIDRAFVGVGGQHVESLNSRGQVAVTAHHREVTREDINRAIEVARQLGLFAGRVMDPRRLEHRALEGDLVFRLLRALLDRLGVMRDGRVPVAYAGGLLPLAVRVAGGTPRDAYCQNDCNRNPVFQHRHSI